MDQVILIIASINIASLSFFLLLGIKRADNQKWQEQDAQDRNLEFAEMCEQRKHQKKSKGLKAAH